MATYAAIGVSSGWVGECWELHDSGGNACTESPIPTPGSPCRETKRTCKQVDHDVAIHCADDRCRIVGAPSPARSEEPTLEQRRDVVITRAGSFTMDVVFKPRGKGTRRVEHIPVTARTPDNATASCTYDGADTIAVELLAGAESLAGGYTELSVTLVGAGPCTRQQADPTSTLENVYRCPAPVKAASVEIRQPDFATTVAVTCS